MNQIDVTIAEDIAASASTALVDWTVTSREELRPRLVVNNHAAGEKVLAHLLRELKDCDSFDFSVAFVRESGLILIADVLDELAERGVRGRLLTGTYLSFNEPKAFRRLLAMENVDVRVFNGSLHAKGYFFHREGSTHLLVGSANITDTALTANQEWNVALSSTDDGDLVRASRREFERLWHHEKTSELSEAWIKEYECFYERQRRQPVLSFSQTLDGDMVRPNAMQVRALEGIEDVRRRGQDKALVISATGTGKTYLSAFDVRARRPRRMLFVVHRENIARAAMESYRRVLPGGTTFGLYTGGRHDDGVDCLFATVQTISRPEHLARFASDHFDYIVIDEVHRAGSPSYRRLIDHFRPRFLLGMSATPERTDGYDIYGLFDHNIAYEIRLQDALEYDLLCPFHYFGVADIEVDGTLLGEDEDFSRLASRERIGHVLRAVRRYGFSGDKVHGLVFCSRRDEADAVAQGLRDAGLRAMSLGGDTSEAERERAIERLEMKEGPDALDYLVTVDIFNEGVDIPAVNQVVMLRPTQSAVVFVQQLGRGLRRAPAKDYVVVIDFIGNYKNNYLIPVALFGDRTGAREKLRRLVFGGSAELPGASTVTFDSVATKTVIDAVNSSNMTTMSVVKQAYRDVKAMLGRVPDLMEFCRYGSLDPTCFFDNKNLGSYVGFLKKYEPDYRCNLTDDQLDMMKFVSREFGNGKRLAEIVLIEALVAREAFPLSAAAERLRVDTEVEMDGSLLGLSDESSLMQVVSATRLLDLSWFTGPDAKWKIPLLVVDGDRVVRSAALDQALKGPGAEEFTRCLLETCDAARWLHERDYARPYDDRPFVIGQRYGRKDACRLACWDRNITAQNIGGYLFRDNDWLVFVTYKKDESISATIKYHDYFVNRNTLHWMSKNGRRVTSPDGQKLSNFNPETTRIHLFVKKNDGEGGDHYYLGTMVPGELSQGSISDDDGRERPVFTTDFRLTHSVDQGIYDYLTEG